MKLVFPTVLFFMCSFSAFSQEEMQEIDTTKSNEYFQKAEDLRMNGNLEEAKEYFRTAIKLNPNHEQAHFLLAWCYYFTSDFNNAITFASKTLELQPNNLSAMTLKAFACFDSGQYKEAIKAFTRSIELDEGKLDVYLRRSASYFYLNDFEKAYEDIKLAYEIDSNDHSVNSIYGNVLTMQGNYSEAVQYLQRSIDLGDENPANYFYLGVSQYVLEDYENSIVNLSTFLGLSPTGSELSEKEIESFSVLGRAYFEIQDYTSAIAFLEEAIQMDTLNVVSYQFYASSFIEMGDSVKSKSLLQEYKTKFPDEGAFDLKLGGLYMQGSDYSKARSNLASAFEKGSDVFEGAAFYREIANNYLQLNDTLAAIEALETAAELMPASSEVLLHLLAVYTSDPSSYSDGLFKTIDQLNGLEKNPEKMSFYFALRALAFAKLGDSEKSISEMTKAIEIDPFHEYFAARAFLIFNNELQRIQADEMDTISEETQTRIFDDIDRALTSNERKEDAFLLKATLLIALERKEEACYAMNKALEYGAEIDQAYRDNVCNGKKLKKKDREWEFNYNLTDYEARFAD